MDFPIGRLLLAAVFLIDQIQQRSPPFDERLELLLINRFGHQWPPSRRAPWKRLAVELLEVRCLPATITVTSTGDAVAVDGVVTLREAITSANNNSNVNTDVVAVGGVTAQTSLTSTSPPTPSISITKTTARPAG